MIVMNYQLRTMLTRHAELFERRWAEIEPDRDAARARRYRRERGLYPEPANSAYARAMAETVEEFLRANDAEATDGNINSVAEQLEAAEDLIFARMEE